MHSLCKTLAGMACLAASLSPAAFGQSSLFHKPQPSDPSSQPKRTVMDAQAAAAAAVTTPTTGTFVAKFTVKLVTTVPTGSELLCVLDASTLDENTTTGTLNNEVEEVASAKATVSGSAATCTATLPYSWYLPDASTDTVALSYQLYIVSSTATSEVGIGRESYQYVPGAGKIKVPANGTTTTYAISATL